MLRLTQSRPPLQINPGLPICDGLLFYTACGENGGLALHDCARNPGLTIFHEINGWGWDRTSRGMAINTTVTAGGGRLALPAYLQLAGSVTLVWFGQVLGNPTANNNSAILSAYGTDTAGATAFAYGIVRDDNAGGLDATQVIWAWDDNGTVRTISSTGILSNNVPTLLALVVDKQATLATAYTNFTVVSTSANVSTITYGTTPSLVVSTTGIHFDLASANIDTVMIGIWGRALAVNDIRLLVEDPQAPLWVPRRTVFALPAVATVMRRTLSGQGVRVGSRQVAG